MSHHSSGSSSSRSTLERAPPRPPPLPSQPTPPLHRLPSLLTGSRSGSASPSTRYGSFPPDGEEVVSTNLVQPPSNSNHQGHHHSQLLEEALVNARNTKKGSRSRKGLLLNRKWERSQERLLRLTRDGKSFDDSLNNHHEGNRDDREEEEDEEEEEERHQSDEPLLETDGEGDEVWNAGDGSWGRRRAAKNLRNAAAARANGRVVNTGSSGGHQEDKQWGVVKMELMARTWGKKGLFTIYAG